MTKVIFGVAFLFVAVTAISGGSEIDGSTAWLWAAGIGSVGIAGLVASIAAIVRRTRT